MSVGKDKHRTSTVKKEPGATETNAKTNGMQREDVKQMKSQDSRKMMEEQKMKMDEEGILVKKEVATGHKKRRRRKKTPISAKRALLRQNITVFHCQHVPS